MFIIANKACLKCLYVEDERDVYVINESTPCILMFVHGNNANHKSTLFYSIDATDLVLRLREENTEIKSQRERGVQQEQVRLGHFVGNPKNDARNCVISG